MVLSDVRNKLAGALLSAFLIASMLGAFSPSAIASEPVDTTVSIPVAQDLLGNVDANDVRYELRSIGGSPMPDGTIDGVYAFTMSGNDFISLYVALNHAGVYEYSIACVEPDRDEVEFDNDIRTVRIYAANASDGSGKVDAAVIFYAADGNKDVKASWTVMETKTTPSPTIPTVPTTTPTDPTGYSTTGDEFKAGVIIAVVIGASIFFLIALYRHRRDD